MRRRNKSETYVSKIYKDLFAPLQKLPQHRHQRPCSELRFCSALHLCFQATCAVTFKRARFSVNLSKLSPLKKLSLLCVYRVVLWVFIGEIFEIFIHTCCFIHPAKLAKIVHEGAKTSELFHSVCLLYVQLCVILGGTHRYRYKRWKELVPFCTSLLCSHQRVFKLWKQRHSAECAKKFVWVL